MRLISPQSIQSFPPQAETKPWINFICRRSSAQAKERCVGQDDLGSFGGKMATPISIETKDDPAISGIVIDAINDEIGPGQNWG